MDEKALTELLECSVCLDQLDHTSKVLPCQHTFCRRCLEEILSTKRELRCPECRFLVECRIEDLPSNILLIRLLEGLKTQSRGSTGGHRRNNSRSPSHSSAQAQASAGNRNQHQRQNNGKNRPCAKALFNYNGKDPGDLTLKKGEIVYLRKQVDDNWFHGELNGQHGFFPANFVQVITPLPSNIPQCKALYDFDVDEEKEGDCLALKKDEVVTVIRKVDDNWIEGKKGDKIGIFPIAFGELNEPAKILLSLSGTASTSNSQDKEPPCTPAQPSRPIKSSSPIPPSLTTSLTQGGDLTSTALPGPQTKRHSLTGVPSSQSTNHSLPQRRSLDISPELQALVLAEQPVVSQGAHQGPPPPVGATSAENKNSKSDSASADPCVSTTATTATAEPARPDKPQGAVVNKQLPPPEDVPFSVNVYVALYNYKPQKADELELHKGDYYSVSEKCQDGWYKGQSAKSGLAGVFPGNYVQPLKSQSSGLKPSNKTSGNRSKGHQQQSHNASNVGVAMTTSNPTSVPPRPKTSPGRSSSSVDPGRSGAVADVCRGRSGSVDDPLPPPIVPRSSKHASPSQHHQSPVSRAATGITTASSSSSSNPSSPNLSSTSIKTTRYVRASKSISPSVGLKGSNRSEQGKSNGSGSNSANSSPVWKHSLSASANITPPNMVVGATGKASSSQMSSSSGKEKEKKEKKEKDKVSLVKKLVSAGKSRKSRQVDPDSTSHSDSSISHNRSGSYPSDMGVVVAGESSHKKSGSFDASTQAGQSRPARPKPLVREKYRSIETYPAQSEIELDLKVGDIIYVHKKRDDGWFKGTLQRSGKMGLVPGSFIEKCE